MSTARPGTQKKMLLGFFNKVFTKFVISGSVKFSSHFKANKLKAHSILPGVHITGNEQRGKVLNSVGSYICKTSGTRVARVVVQPLVII